MIIHSQAGTKCKNIYIYIQYNIFAAYECMFCILIFDHRTNYFLFLLKRYDLNVRAVFHVTQQMLPLLRASGSVTDPARIINISSIDSITQPSLNTFAYSSGKAAVSHLSRVLASKLADDHITVNNILPGAFSSRMMRGTIAMVGEDLMGKSIPLQRIGSTLDMAGVAVMLAGRAGAWMTGASIVLDGGAVIKSRL